MRLASVMGLAGITNRPDDLDRENQERVERRKDELPDERIANRPRKDHPLDKDREEPIEGRGRIVETGAGRGTDHKGH